MSCTLSGTTLSSTGTINLRSTGTINLMDGTTQYGSFTGDLSGDLTITSGNNSATITLDASAVIINNPNNSSATATGSIYMDSGPNLNITSPNILNLNSTNQNNATINLNLNSTNQNNATINLKSNGTQFGSFTSNGGSLTISSSSLSGGNINFGNYGYVTVNAINEFTISPFKGYSLTLNSNYSNGTINLQNGGTTYGYILNDSGLHIKNNSNYILIDSNSNPIYMYTGSSSSNGLVLQTDPGATYGSFSGDTNGDLTISSGSNLNLISQSSHTINLCCGTNSSGDTTININTPTGAQVVGNYCTISTSGSGSNLSITTAGAQGTMSFNASGGLITNYNGATLGSDGIVNGIALQSIFGGVNSSILGGYSYNYTTPRYVTNANLTDYQLVIRTANYYYYGGTIYFNTPGFYLVSINPGGLINGGECSVWCVVAAQDQYWSQVIINTNGYLSVGVLGTTFDNTTPIGNGTGLFFYCNCQYNTSNVMFSTMQIG